MTTTTTTSTTTTDFTSSTTTTSPFVSRRCYESLLTSSQDNIAKYLMYVCAAWIILWCLITIITNKRHKNSGHHRYIHLFEEIGIILLAIFMCILNFALDRNSKICKYIAIVNDFFMCFTCSIFLMESFFASAMVNGKSDKNGGLPVVVYYVLPIIIALVPTLVSYFPEKDLYGTTGLHCFVVSTSDMFWAFVIPIWLILFGAILKSQLSCISCDRQKESQDEKQVYWARKSAKSLSLISLMLFSIWMMVMLSAEHQKIYLFILTFLLVLLFGPTIFIIHTFGHLNTCQKYAGTGLFAKLYTMCPPKEKPEKTPKYDDDDDYDDPLPNDEPQKQPESEPEPKPEPEKKPNDEPQTEPAKTDPVSKPKPPEEPKNEGPAQHTKAQNFYSWLKDNERKQNSKEVLFTPTLY